MRVEAPPPPWPNSALMFHWAAVTTLLLLLIPIIGTESVWSADVGAQLAQSSRLAEGGGWLFPHPLPTVDPAGEWYTFHLSGRNGDDFVVLAKHPLFTWIVAGLWQLGGLGAVMASSVISTTVAALGAAAVVSQSVHQRCGIATLWITATLSPLAFDGFLGYAHTLVAATAIWSLLFAIQAVQNRRGRVRSLFLATVFIALGPFLRSEATLAGIALGLGLLATAGQWPTISNRRTARCAGLLLGGVTFAGFLIDRAWAIPVRFNEPATVTSTWVEGRFSGFNATWLWTASTGWRQQDLLLVAVPTLWCIGARLFDRSPRTARLAFGSGAALAILWTASDPGHIVPGLLFAFPLLVLLVGLSRSEMFHEPIEALSAVSFLAFSCAVILTQHAQGGTSEWGGRYFAVGIPFAVIALGGSTQRLVELRRDLSISMAGPVLLASLVILGGGLFGIRQSKQLVNRLDESVEQASRQTATSLPADAVNDEVVVVSTVNGASRWAWEAAREDTWLLVPPEDIDEAMERLSAAGFTRVVVVAETRHETDRSLGPYANVDVVQPWEASPLEVLAFHGS